MNQAPFLIFGWPQYLHLRTRSTPLSRVESVIASLPCRTGARACLSAIGARSSFRPMMSLTYTSLGRCARCGTMEVSAPLSEAPAPQICQRPNLKHLGWALRMVYWPPQVLGRKPNPSRIGWAAVAVRRQRVRARCTPTAACAGRRQPQRELALELNTNQVDRVSTEP